MTLPARPRVVHLYHDFWPARGGIEDYLADLTRAQAAQGLEPIVLCANDRPVTRSERFSAPGAQGEQGGVTVLRAASFGRYFMPFCPGWLAWLRRLRPDVVHLHLPCPLGEWVVWLARPRRLIVSLHNDYVRPRLALAFHRPLHRAVLGQAKAIIVGAPDYAHTSPALHGLHARVWIVPYGINLQDYELQEPPSLPLEGRFDVLSAGRLCYYKGIEVLLDAAPSIQGRIAIIGDGPWRKKLRAQAQQNGLDERLCFMGALSEPALIARLQAGRVFVFPSTERSEAFGLAQLKAMACGLPVVSSDLPGVSWLNRHGQTGLTVPVRDAAALAGAVNQLLADPALRRQLAAGARARARQFDLARMVRETRHVYDSLD